MKQLRLIAVLFSILSAASVTAQGGDTDPCTLNELIAISEVVDEYTIKIADITSTLNTDSISDFSRLIARAFALDEEWWIYGISRMPDCSTGTAMRETMGRWLDAVLIDLLLIDGGYFDLQERHLVMHDRIGADIRAIASQLEMGLDSNAYTPEILYTVTGANVRPCANTTAACAPVGELAAETSVSVIGLAQGESIGGTSLWYQINWNGSVGYVHSTVLTGISPAAPATSRSSPSGCGGATTCGQMSSCSQAYACLLAGNDRLDADSDGVPCESICGN